jgi:GT2 family glycosyltransferase
MINLEDVSILIVSAVNSKPRLESVYNHIRAQYPNNEIVLVYDNINYNVLNVADPLLIQVPTNSRVYVSIGYNLAIKACTKKYFVFLHDDTYTAPNFLENIVQHITPKTFCNFVTVEPPLFGNPDTIQKPIRDFGTKAEDFNKDAFDAFYWEHVNRLPYKQEPSTYGGFFMAGCVESFKDVGGFDEQYKPYFYEDSDLMIRLHIAGFRFVLSLDSIVYHIGSLTSRTSNDSVAAHNTTHDIFIHKWKTTFEHLKHYTMLNNMNYETPNVRYEVHNADPALNHLISLLNTDDGNIQISANGQHITQQDVDYLLQLPYLLQSTEKGAVYTIGNLTIKT